MLVIPAVVVGTLILYRELMSVLSFILSSGVRCIVRGLPRRNYTVIEAAGGAACLHRTAAMQYFRVAIRQFEELYAGKLCLATLARVHRSAQAAAEFAFENLAILVLRKFMHKKVLFGALKARDRG